MSGHSSIKVNNKCISKTAGRKVAAPFVRTWISPPHNEPVAGLKLNLLPKGVLEGCSWYCTSILPRFCSSTSYLQKESAA